MCEGLGRSFKEENRLIEKTADLNESETEELMKTVGHSVELTTGLSAATASERMKRIVSGLREERQKVGVEEDPKPLVEEVPGYEDSVFD